MVLPIKRYFALLRTYLRPQWHRTVLLTIFLVLNIGAQLFNPQVLRYFIDAALTGGTSFSLVFAGLLFVGVAFFNQGISVASSYLSTNIAWTATNRLRTDLLRHCLGLDMGFHKAHTPGEMIERIDGDVDDLSNFFSQFVVSMLTNLVMLIGILVLFFTIHWLAGVALTLFALLVFVLLLLLRRPAVHLWRAEREMSSTFYGFLGERLGGTENIRANGATAYTMRRFYLLVRQWFPIRKRAVVYSNLAFALTLFLFICGSALALAIGMYLWSLHLVSVGTVYVMYSYTNLLTQPLQQIQTQLQDLQQAEACIGRIEELLGLSSALRDGNKQLPARSDGTSRPQPLPVQFRDVTFGYVVEEPVLQHLSFAIEPGHVLGVLG
ncbi:MAG TPA: ABC transporter ATP-binding protein, partial [Ktedonobacteraceae bacterium]|nr:ABC transporter ATP-binding protein [Ktedonobacteraceae bacterium]